MLLWVENVTRAWKLVGWLKVVSALSERESWGIGKRWSRNWHSVNRLTWNFFSPLELRILGFKDPDSLLRREHNIKHSYFLFPSTSVSWRFRSDQIKSRLVDICSFEACLSTLPSFTTSFDRVPPTLESSLPFINRWQRRTEPLSESSEWEREALRSSVLSFLKWVRLRSCFQISNRHFPDFLDFWSSVHSFRQAKMILSFQRDWFWFHYLSLMTSDLSQTQRKILSWLYLVSCNWRDCPVPLSESLPSFLLWTSPSWSAGSLAANDDQINAMIKVAQKLTLKRDFDPHSYKNPELVYQDLVLLACAFEEEIPDPPAEDISPNYETIEVSLRDSTFASSDLLITKFINLISFSDFDWLSYPTGKSW